MLDEFLAGIWLGVRDMTISRWAEQAQAAGDWRGCILCWFLHWMLRQNHCLLVRLNRSLGPTAEVLAAVWLSVAFLLTFFWLPLAAYLIGRL